MDKASYLKENTIGSMKENSPPCSAENADGGLNNNDPRTAVGENSTRIDNKPAMQQPLQVNNQQQPSSKQNVQPELLKKFRQLRQWQQQQQETMFKKQQQQMEAIKTQQDKLQMLFKKTASSGTSPSTMTQNLFQVDTTQTSNMRTELLSTKQSNNLGTNTVMLSPMDKFSRTIMTKEQMEPYQPLAVVSPLRNQGFHYSQGTPNGNTTSPVLMTPMQFTTRASYSSTSPDLDDRNSSKAVYTTAESTRVALISHGLHQSQHNAEFRDTQGFYGINSDMESDCPSDVETMSGIYPLQDDNMSEVCGTERDEEELSDRQSSDEEQELEDTVCERFLNNDEEEPVATESVEDRPIKPGVGTAKAATFEELLEKELTSGSNHENAATTTLYPSPQKPQRTFLRKGQGLTRFRMKPPQPKKSKSLQQKSNSPPLKRPTNLSKPLKENINQRDESSQKEFTIPQVKVQRKIAGRTTQALPDPVTTVPQMFGSNVLASRVIGPFTSMPYSMPTTNMAVTKTTLTVDRRDGQLSGHPLLSPLSSLDFSFQGNKKQLEETKDDEDLEEFEMLEEAAANASFSSNSSLVVKVIQRAKTKTTGSNVPSTAQSNSVPTSRASPANIPNILSPVDTGYESCEGRGPDSVNVVTQASSATEDITENESSDDDNDTTLQEVEEDAEDEPYNQHPLEMVPTTITSQEDFDDEEAWGEIKTQPESTETESDEDSDDSDVTIGDPFSRTVLQLVEQPHQSVGTFGSNVVSTPPTSALVSKLFPKMKQNLKVQEEQSNVTEEKKCEVNETTGPSQEVQEKLKELEEEISKFRLENKALAKIRNERDEGLKRLQNEINLFEKQKTEELERIEKFRKEEMQKLKRERKVFDKYQKAAKSIPDKKERDEIEALKSQVSELQEELKRRESRWSAASSRYRNRIEALEEQNKELQEEVKLLEKYRLERWRDKEMKAKDNEEARPRDTVLRKTAKPVEPAKHPLQQETTNKDMNDSVQQVLPKAASPLRDTKEPISAVDANNNKDSTTVFPRKLKQVDSASPNDVQHNIVKQGAPIHVPTNHPASKDNQSSTLHTRLGRLQEIEHPDGKVEQVQPDGSRVILFANGTRKEISKDGHTVIVSFFNGDFKQVFPDQRVVYHYSEAQTTHTTYPDGLEVLQFPNNQIEKHYVDGTKEIIFPDQTIKYLYVDGTEECVYADGTIQRTRTADGERIIEFPNGQREVHNKHFKRREYPDGTVKTVYPDGRTETRYSTGRLRVKDREGRVVMDTAEHLLQE